MNIKQVVVAVGISLATIAAANVIDAANNSAMAEATVTLCAKTGKVLDKIKNKQCITVKQKLGRGEREVQKWPGNRVDVKISNKKATRGNPNSAGDAVRFMEKLGDKLYKSFKKHGAIYAEIRMQGCSGSWTPYCFTADIGKKPSGFSRWNSTYSASEAYRRVSNKPKVSRTRGKATGRLEKCRTVKITTSLGWDVKKQCGFIIN